MTQPAKFGAIETATGITWDDWVAYLQKAGANDLPHKQIAELAYEKLHQVASGGWWAQSVAVAYEQHIGRRQPGQRSDGTFEASVSKSVEGPLAKAMQRWLDLVEGKTQFDGIAVAKPPTTSQTDKNHHWGCSLADGSRANADVSDYQKTPGKVSLTITHTKLSSAEDAQHWKAFWQKMLRDF